ncbi:transcriptional regulator PpsR [Pseudooctadecabacter jejudonensis]|uniref:Sensory histidine kinase AtoS n=1 Tax=Pseudooctadecabacter jejudonensis TaxID=1391910 RepID=A0A1Y5S624_9RHOB|nr:transcriptional regulator PpsR [Pseudooctadecabacter jejudonensis]SLN32445.1 sensory histidine kinase AtoS [Pseudooctadecabacter jejudonensis]
MTSRGTKYWDTGTIPLIAPEMLGDIIAALADVALVISDDGQIKSVIANPTHEALDDLSHWESKHVSDTLTRESRPKFDRALQQFLDNDPNVRPVQLNHSDDGRDIGLPVNYSFHHVGPDGSLLMLGRDLRPISEMQQQLVKAQIALEQDYEQQREYDTRFRVLMESSRDAVVFVALNTGRIIDVNSIAARLLGRDRDDLIGSPFAQEFDGRRKGELMDALSSSALAEGPSSLSVNTRQGRKAIRVHPTMFRATGERVMLCRLDLSEGGAPVTDDLPERLSGLFDQGADAIAFTDQDGNLTSVNEAFLELTNVAHALNVKGRSLADYLHRGNVDLRVLLENAARVGHIRLYSTRMAGEFGEPRTVEISATYLSDLENPSYAFIMRDASRADAVRVAPAPVGQENVKSVMELVGSATLKEIVAETTDVVERMCIETALELTSNNRVAAAEMLGLSRQSLYVKLRKYVLLNKND